MLGTRAHASQGQTQARFVRLFAQNDDATTLQKKLVCHITMTEHAAELALDTSLATRAVPGEAHARRQVDEAVSDRHVQARGLIRARRALNDAR